jgi:hypothetical protein
MVGVSSSIIIDSLAFGCVIPHMEEYTDGCRTDVLELQRMGFITDEKEEKREREKCFNRVRYAFSVIRSTNLVFEGEYLVYLVPCIMYFRAMYEEKWVGAFRRHVKILVEPNYTKPMKIDEEELRRALKYSKSIPGYYDLRAITRQLALVNKSITSIIILLESVTLKDGTKIHIRDHLSQIIKETLNEDNNIERMRRQLDFNAGEVLGTSLSRMKFLLELLIALLTVASFSQRPWHKPAPRTYIRALRAYQEFYSEKLNKIRERRRKENKDIHPELLNPSYYVKKRVSEELESILRTISKLFENTRNYIDTYYSIEKVNKNTRSTANRLLTGFISGRLLLSLDTIKILSEIVRGEILSHVVE